MNDSKKTINEIAEIAGVSRSTVSRVLNDRSDVSEKTREKIKEVMDQYNYRPSVQAKRTITRQINTLGLLLGNRIFINPMDSEIIRGVLSKASKCGYDLTICSGKTAKWLIDMYNEQRFEGYIILNPYTFEQEMLEELKNKNIPFCCTSICGDLNQYMCVDVDNEKAAYRMTEYLIMNGHRNIGILKTHESSHSTALRLLGYQKCLEKYQIPFVPERVISCETNQILAGYNGMKKLLENPDSLTSVFAFSDFLAIGAVRAVKDSNLKVPQDISVVGFDDIALNEMAEVFLTTVRQSGYQRGYRACEKLLDCLSGVSSDSGHNSEFVPFEIIIRDTVQPNDNL